MLDYRIRRSLETEAIARVTWGESASDVRAWLIDSGLSMVEAARLVRECSRRRATEMRSRGVRDLVFGIPALVLAVTFAVGGFIVVEWLALPGAGSFGRGAGLIFAPALWCACYGGWKTLRGFDRVVFGARADGAVSDVE